MRKFHVMLLTGLIMLLIALPLLAQKKAQKTVKSYGTVNNTHFFQSYFFDTPIAATGYGEGGLIYVTSKYKTPGGSFSSSAFSPGIQGGYPINDKIELQASLRYISASTETAQGDQSESGLSDLGVAGRYNVYDQNQTNISVGGMLTLPIGSEDVGESNLNFGAFGAIRHSLQSGLVLAGTLGLIFQETEEINFTTGKKETEHDSYLNIGLGGIYPLNPQLNLIGELVIWSEGEYMLLSCGTDYLLGNGRLRGALGLGLDDGAPDFMLIGGYQISF